VSRRRIVVASSDPVTAAMAGPAIRAWHMASVLAEEHEVRLITTAACDRDHPAFAVRRVEGPDDMRSLAEWADLLVFQGGLLRDFPFLQEPDPDLLVVADIYDPFHLENLEQGRGESASMASRDATVGHLAAVLNEQLLRGDFFLCASARQRDFWLGSLAAVGRVNPWTYDEDPTLGSLIGIAPFGLEAAPPVRREPALRGVVPGIGADDKVILWAGGVYNWFDPLSLVRAVDRLRVRVPDVRLFFLGLRHPNPDIPAMQMASSLRSLSDELGLTGSHVFFNDGWVEYDRRADFLLDADLGVSTHLGHVETAFSFRTRILDYLWAGLPIVATEGDAFADLIDRERLGATVPAGDIAALEAALFSMLSDPALAAECRENVLRVAPRFRWAEVLAPLVEFCRSPRRAPDLVGRGEAAAPAAPAAAAPAPVPRSLVARAGGKARRLLGR